MKNPFRKKSIVLKVQQNRRGKKIVDTYTIPKKEWKRGNVITTKNLVILVSVE